MTNIINLHHHPEFIERGFLFGESLYDVIAFYQKKMIFPREHFDRFCRDLHLMKIPVDLSFETFMLHAQSIIDAFEEVDGGLYFQVTSGQVSRRQSMPPSEEQPGYWMMAFSAPRPNVGTISAGVGLALFAEQRGPYCYVKSTNRLPSRLAMLYARDQGAQEALWYDPKNRYLHEGCSSNLFLIQDNKLITPELSPYIFPGIARGRVIELAEKMNIPCIVRNVLVEEIDQSDGAFITGSIKQLLPIRKIDQKSFPIHPLWKSLFIEYNNMIDQTHQIQ